MNNAVHNALRASAELDRRAAWELPTGRVRFHGDGRPPEVLSGSPDVLSVVYNHVLTKRERLREASNLLANLAVEEFERGNEFSGGQLAEMADLVAEAADTLEAIGKLTGDVQEPVKWSISGGSVNAADVPGERSFTVGSGSFTLDITGTRNHGLEATGTGVFRR